MDPRDHDLRRGWVVARETALSRTIRSAEDPNGSAGPRLRGRLGVGQRTLAALLGRDLVRLRTPLRLSLCQSVQLASGAHGSGAWFVSAHK